MLEPEICYGDKYQTYPMSLDHTYWQDQPIALESFSGRNKHSEFARKKQVDYHREMK